MKPDLHMMVFAHRQWLIFLWKSGLKAPTELVISIGGEPLDKPYLALTTDLPNVIGLVAHSNGAAKRSRSKVTITDGSGRRLAHLKSISIYPVSRIWEAFPEAAQAERFLSKLIRNAPRRLPHWSPDMTRDIGSVLHAHRQPAQAFGPQFSMRGEVEGRTGSHVIGWARDLRTSFQAAAVDVYMNGQWVDTVQADRFRQELKLPSDTGRYGFSVDLTKLSKKRGSACFALCFAGTTRHLDGSPFMLGQLADLGGYVGRTNLIRPSLHVGSSFELERAYSRAGTVEETTKGPRGRFVLDCRGELRGWLNNGGTGELPPVVSVVLDGGDRFAADVSQLAVQRGDSFSNASCRITAPLPDGVFDTSTHTIAVECSDAEGTLLFATENLAVRSVYRGKLDAAIDDYVTGWVVDALAPRRPVTVDFVVNGRYALSGMADMPRPDIPQGENNAGSGGFRFRVPDFARETGITAFDFFLSGSQTPLLDRPIQSLPYDIAIRALVDISEQLNLDRETNSVAWTAQSWVRTEVITRVIDALRQARRLGAPVHFRPNPSVSLPRRKDEDPTVDVIIPVYQGYEETLNCIQSVLNAGCETPCELIVINDASPDRELTAELRVMCQEHGFTLCENPENLGFVATVNRGMQFNPARDVVLLNSDTLVPAGWLDRLRAAALRSPNIGTVTPFSNSATILSFPEPHLDNQLPQGWDVDRLDTLFALMNSEESVDIPTAIGFCMYIKRAALDEVGYFNEERWGKGYGEENEFCLLASQMGWRHVAACDLFVQHEGGVSFRDEKEGRSGENLLKLVSLFPDYASSVTRFALIDPLRSYRRRVLKPLIRPDSGDTILFVIHGLGGGVQVAADRMAEDLLRLNFNVLELSAETKTKWVLRNCGLPYRLHYKPEDFDELADDLSDLGVSGLHYHHTLNFGPNIWELAERLGVDYDVTIHDLMPVCPRINMVDQTDEYCGRSQFSPDACKRCIQHEPLPHELDEQYYMFGGSIEKWRDFYERVIEKAENIWAPSQSAADIVRSHLDLPNIRVKPHPIRGPSAVRRSSEISNRYNVIVLGAIGPNKGFQRLRECAEAAISEGLPLRFQIIGYTCDDLALSGLSNVRIFGPYSLETLPELIEAADASVALFLSVSPETYSFTLTEAWQHGLFPVALDVGAIGERIRNTGNGRLLPLKATAREINQALLDVLSPEFGRTVATDFDLQGIVVAGSMGGMCGAKIPNAVKLIDPMRRAESDA